MLPKAHRLTNSEDFRRTVRSGQRSVTPTVVVHSTFDGIFAAEPIPSALRIDHAPEAS